MPLFKFGKTDAPPSLSREQALACVPRKNHLVREEPLAGGLVRLTYPLSWKPWFGGLAKRLGAWDSSPRDKRLDLDVMGTAAWKLLDGKRDARTIIDLFAAKFDLQPREAEVSMTAFLKELGKRGLVLMLQGPVEPETQTRGKKGKRKKKKNVQ